MGPQVENNQASAHLGSKGFHMAFESWTSAQQSPRYVPDKFGPIGPFFYLAWAQGVTGAHTLHISKRSSNELKKSFL